MVLNATDFATVRSLTIPNRIVVPPMCIWAAEKGTGLANDVHLVHYASLAESGVGMIIVEATAVSPSGCISPSDLGLWSDTQIAPLRRVVDYVHDHTPAKMAVQLGHCGRKGPLLNPMSANPIHLHPKDEFGCQCVAPSPIAHQDGMLIPKEMNLGDIQCLKKDFIDAAVRAVRVGFDAIEIHCAHGYLLHSFYSPVSNKRTDEYGGTFENRIRLPLEVVEGVRNAIPASMPLLVRLSCTDWVENGWTLEDSVKLCAELKKRGADIIDCSSGGVSASQNIRVGFNYQVPFAEEIKKKTGIHTIAVGGIKTYQEVASILAEGRSSFVAIGRAFLKDVYWFRNHVPLTEGSWCPPRQIMGFRQSSRKQALQEKVTA